METTDLETSLAHFTGTEAWHRYSPLFRQLLLTDGVKFLCENAGAYWLVDAIGSHIFTNRKVFDPRQNPMQFWNLTVTGDKAVLTCTDGGKHGEEPIELARQDIEFTDFPLPKIDIWAAWELGLDPKGAFVLMLPSEY